MKILIKVTKDILKKSMYCGVVNNDNLSKNCAIALAVRDVFPDASIGLYTMGLMYGHEMKVPKKMQAFISAFDILDDRPEKRLEMPEMSFELNIPNEVINQIGIGQIYKCLSESRTLELVHP